MYYILVPTYMIIVDIYKKSNGLFSNKTRLITTVFLSILNVFDEKSMLKSLIYVYTNFIGNIGQWSQTQDFVSFLLLCSFSFIKALILLFLFKLYFIGYFFSKNPQVVLLGLLPIESVNMEKIPWKTLELLHYNNNIITHQGLCFILLVNCLIASFYLLITKNPIYALLSLISVFLNAIILLLLLKIEFLALTFLIIYVGAIAILFLFVIMMFNLKKLQSIETSPNLLYTAVSYIIILCPIYIYISGYIHKLLLSAVARGELLSDTPQALSYLIKYKTNDIFIFSELLYNYYSLLFLLTGLILLTAMLGSIILALSTIEDTTT